MTRGVHSCSNCGVDFSPLAEGKNTARSYLTLGYCVRCADQLMAAQGKRPTKDELIVLTVKNMKEILEP